MRACVRVHERKQERIFIKQRKGFVKLAIQAGVGQLSHDQIMIFPGRRAHTWEGESNIGLHGKQHHLLTAAVPCNPARRSVGSLGENFCCCTRGPAV